MKSVLAIAAALTLCASAFAAPPANPATGHGVMASARQEAHQIGSSFRRDMHRIAHADKFRQQQAADQRRMGSHTTAMGAGPAHGRMMSSRDERMNAAYADWERSHRR